METKFLYKMTGKLVVFSAPSGSGKTTIVKEILSDNKYKFEFSISATSRKPRGKEENGKDYYFLSAEEFKSKINNNEFVEWEEVYKNQFYGTLKNEIERITQKGYNVIFDVDVVGGINIKKQYNNECLIIFIMPPSITELENRLRHRGTETEESIKKRIAKAEKEMTFSEKFDKIVINDDLKVAVNEVREIIETFLD